MLLLLFLAICQILKAYGALTISYMNCVIIVDKSMLLSFGKTAKRSVKAPGRPVSSCNIHNFWINCFRFSSNYILNIYKIWTEWSISKWHACEAGIGTDRKMYTLQCLTIVSGIMYRHSNEGPVKAWKLPKADTIISPRVWPNIPHSHPSTPPTHCLDYRNDLLACIRRLWVSPGELPNMGVWFPLQRFRG